MKNSQKMLCKSECEQIETLKGSKLNKGNTKQDRKGPKNKTKNELKDITTHMIRTKIFKSKKSGEIVLKNHRLCVFIFSFIEESQFPTE